MTVAWQLPSDPVLANTLHRQLPALLPTNSPFHQPHQLHHSPKKPMSSFAGYFVGSSSTKRPGSPALRTASSLHKKNRRAEGHNTNENAHRGQKWPYVDSWHTCTIAVCVKQGGKTQHTPRYKTPAAHKRAHKTLTPCCSRCTQASGHPWVLVAAPCRCCC